MNECPRSVINKRTMFLKKKCLYAIADELHVFHVGKRNPPYQHWEPIYIGTHDDPLYDERLSWEGRSDKMTQVCKFFFFWPFFVIFSKTVCFVLNRDTNFA